MFSFQFSSSKPWNRISYCVLLSSSLSERPGRSSYSYGVVMSGYQHFMVMCLLISDRIIRTSTREHEPRRKTASSEAHRGLTVSNMKIIIIHVCLFGNASPRIKLSNLAGTLSINWHGHHGVISVHMNFKESENRISPHSLIVSHHASRERTSR